MATRSFWAWGYEEAAFDDKQIHQLRQLVGMQFGQGELRCQGAPAQSAGLLVSHHERGTAGSGQPHVRQIFS